MSSKNVMPGSRLPSAS